MSVIPELKHLGTIYLHPHILVKVTPIWILVSASDLKWPYWIIRGLQLDWKETWCFIIWSSRPIVERNEQGDYSTNIASASFANTVFVKIPVWTMDRCDWQKSPPYHMIWKINDISTLSFVSHRCLAPIDIANLWKDNRIRIIMGEFGCTQIRTSNSCSSKRNSFLAICFLGSEYFAQRFNRPFGENSQTNLVGCVFGHPGHIFCQILGL